MLKWQWLPLLFMTCSSVCMAFGSAKGVDGFKVIDSSHYQVFSQRGVGSFNLMAMQNTPYSVCFYYRDQERFDKLEGVTINVMTAGGDKQVTQYEIQNGCVHFQSGENEDLPLQIEFVDAYR